MLFPLVGRIMPSPTPKKLVYVQSVEAVMMVCKMAGVELSLQMKLRLLSAVDFCGGSGVDSELPLQGAQV